MHRIFLDNRISTGASTVQETLTDGVHKLERSIENLNVRLARLLAEYSASQAKLKQRIAKLELRWVFHKNFRTWGRPWA